MHLREAPSQTIGDLRELFAPVADGETIACRNSDIRIDLTDEKSVIFGENHNFTVPITPTTISRLADWIEVPAKFLLRQDKELQQIILAHLFGQSDVEVAVRFTDAGILELFEPGRERVDPRRIVDIAAKTVGENAVLVEAWNSPRAYQFDVVVADNVDFGIGGDRAVGDITKGGLRFGQDVQHNLAPWVQPYMLRLVCTNGQETFDGGLRVDARGQSVDDVLMELELAAQRAFGRIEREIEAFYSLREHKVENPERVLFRIAEESGLPTRTAARLAEEAPALGDDVSMFDIVNLITNQANDPTIRNRASVRRGLEQTGGYVVRGADAARCTTCQSLLGEHSHSDN